MSRPAIDSAVSSGLPVTLLGRTGLRVSRLSLGTMTFGQLDWGCDEGAAHGLLETYLAAGGNVIDTADIYAGGESERIVGRFLADTGQRDQVVLASKYALGQRPGLPNSGGNGRVALRRTLQQSLERLGTDHLDLLFLHAWDGVTPVEEVMRALDEVVRAGLVRHVALSDIPAWYAARAHTVAQWRGYEPPAAVQLEYSLAERGLEYEFPAMCEELGMGLMTWGPLANGWLSGKYADVARAANPGAADLPEGRVKATSSRRNPATDKNNPRTWAVIEVLDEESAKVDAPPAQVAIAWLLQRPAVSTVILGARRPDQLEQTLAAATLELPAEVVRRLDEVSAPPRAMPYGFLQMVTTNLTREIDARRQR